jgi:hypothetical protein
MRHPALTGELAVLWLVVLRMVADLHWGEPGPFALASIGGSPIHRRHGQDAERGRQPAW